MELFQKDGFWEKNPSSTGRHVPTLNAKIYRLEEALFIILKNLIIKQNSCRFCLIKLPPVIVWIQKFARHSSGGTVCSFIFLNTDLPRTQHGISLGHINSKRTPKKHWNTLKRGLRQEFMILK